MKAPATLLIAVLLLWMCGSAYYYVANIKEYDNHSTNTATTSDNKDKSVVEVKITKEKIAPKTKKGTAQKEIKVKTRTVYFDFNINNFIADDDFESYMSDLNSYLRSKKGNRITLIGHTDAKGSEKVNIRIGMERAGFVKDILVEAGLNPDQINPESRGEREASKLDSPDGRSKDRRVEIIAN